MSRVAAEDSREITHITHVCNAIHDFGDDLYEDLMERDYDKAKEKAESLIRELKDLITSMSDEV